MSFIPTGHERLVYAHFLTKEAVKRGSLVRTRSLRFLCPEVGP